MVFYVADANEHEMDVVLTRLNYNRRDRIDSGADHEMSVTIPNEPTKATKAKKEAVKYSKILAGYRVDGQSH